MVGPAVSGFRVVGIFRWCGFGEAKRQEKVIIIFFKNEAMVSTGKGERDIDVFEA